MRYYFDLICHYLTSNSRHGTHSPFVYKMADEVIYEKSKGGLKTNASNKMAYKILIEEIIEYYTSASTIYLVNTEEYSLEDIIRLQREYDFIFFDAIYKNMQNKKKWSALVADPNIVVTIDLFYFGIIISRNEQLKENFKLRFPYAKY